MPSTTSYFQDDKKVQVNIKLLKKPTLLFFLHINILLWNLKGLVKDLHIHSAENTQIFKPSFMNNFSTYSKTCPCVNHSLKCQAGLQTRIKKICFWKNVWYFYVPFPWFPLSIIDEILLAFIENSLKKSCKWSWLLKKKLQYIQSTTTLSFCYRSWVWGNLSWGQTL